MLSSFNEQIWEIENYWITHEAEDLTSYSKACWKPYLIAYQMQLVYLKVRLEGEKRVESVKCFSPNKPSVLCW